MKKNLALLLVVATVFTCLLGFSASAAKTDVHNKIASITVPMRSTVSFLIAVEVSTKFTSVFDEDGTPKGQLDANGKVRVQYLKEQADGTFKAIGYVPYVGTLEKDGTRYWIYELQIDAADIATQYRARVAAQYDFVYTFSAAQFLNEYITANQGTENDAYATLADKMLTYGEKVAKYAALQ